MSESLQESAQLWESFKDHIANLAEDPDYNMTIRQRGLEVKNMYFGDGVSNFSIESRHPYTIPYSTLLLGCEGCIQYIELKIASIKKSLES